MATSLEKKILREVKRRGMKRYCSDFHEAVIDQTGLMVGNQLIDALEYILRNTNYKQFQRVGIILEGLLQQRIRGHVHRQSGLMQYSVRVGRVSGTSVYLPKPAPRFLDAKIELTAKEAQVNWTSDGKIVRTSAFHPKEYFTYRELRKRILDNCSGVFIDEIDKKRRIRYCNTNASIPTWCASTIFLSVHHEGEVYHFDLSKRLILTSTGTPDYTESKRLEKASQMYEASESFDYEAYRIEVTQNLIRRWQEDPEEFNKWGRLVIIKGRHKVKIGRDGNVGISLIDDNGRKSKLVASIHYADSEAEVEFRARTVFLYHDDGGLINAHVAEGIGFQRYFFEGSKPLEYIGLRKVNPKGKMFSVGLNGIHYRFSVPEGFLSHSENSPFSCAIVYHQKLEGDQIFHLVTQCDDRTKVEEIKPTM